MRAVPIKAGDLAAKLECGLEGDSGLLLTGISTIEEAAPDQLTFLANPRYRKYLPACKAGAIIISADEEVPAGFTKLISTRPYLDFQQALKIMYQVESVTTFHEISKQSVVADSAQIGKDVHIGSFVEVSNGVVIGDGCIINNGAYIGPEVKIGKNCIIGYCAVLRQEVELGDRVVVGDATVIGFDGFGYAPDEAGYQKIPQIGTVVIEDDVEIGANCCIDRAAVGVTRIGRGSKMDNLIQVAHGVKIGENTVIAAQTGISGSTRIGSKVLMGGQVGISGHLEIGDGMIIGAQAGIAKSVDIKGMISGYPARPHAEALRRDANVSRLPKLLKRIKELEQKVAGLLGR